MYLSSQYSQSQASEDSCLISERQRSGIFSLNEQPTYGIYNRNDYMARCYRGCWKKNARNGPELKKLLCFGGQSSTSGDCCSASFFLCILLLPFISLLTLIRGKEVTFAVKISVSSITLAVCLIISVWHVYSIYVMVTNKRKWIQSWFTFIVHENVLVPHSTQVGSRFFDIRKHLKYYDVTRDSLSHFPLLNSMRKQQICFKFNDDNMNRARIILYTTRFLDSLYVSTRNMAIVMLTLSLVCAIISLYELMVVWSL